MKHLRSDYNRIQDPEGKIGENEPVFLVRAQDETMLEVLRHYCHLQRSRGNMQMAIHIEDQLGAVVEWQHQNKTKLPDLPKGILPTFLAARS